MAASDRAGLVRNRDREKRDAGAAPSRGRARKPKVEGLERRRLLSLAAPPPIDGFPVTAGSSPAGIATGPDGAMWFTESNGNKIGRITAGSLTEYGMMASAIPRRCEAPPKGVSLRPARKVPGA
jgi:streptogramin lyase